jgi:hypothetical protein
VSIIERKSEVHTIANDGTFRNERLEKFLLKGTVEVSAYMLNEPRTAQGYVIAGEGLKTFKCLAVAKAVAHARDCRDCPKYEVQVRFDGNHRLQETIEERHVLIQFLEGFL